MKEKIIFIALLCFGFLSCTKEKTDYLAEIETVVPDYTEFKEAASIQGSGYRVILEALNGTFYTGYNDIRLRVHRMDTDEEVEATSVTFLPIRWTGVETTDSAPHQYELTYDSDKGYYSGYSVFTSETKGQSHWEVYISFNIAGQKYFVHQEVSVQQQDNKNLSMTEFTGEDGERYYIALIAPRVPKVAENELVAGVYKRNTPEQPSTGNFPDPAQYSYSQVNDFVLQLDPRMPEPSMGNHSSPGNKDLVQQSDGLYYGLVNYTMTGNWTLNLILLNPHGAIVKGTEVPADFTPGVEGIKSELHIDILF